VILVIAEVETMSERYQNIWLFLAHAGFFILLLALVAKIFGCVPPWTNYTFWAGMGLLGITSLMLIPYLDKDLE
jgi:quinol-cytochrome oxidoreductase complex cytochrome b subunit